jgi:hypothetical protein
MLNITNASPVTADIGSLERTTRVSKVISIACAHEHRREGQNANPKSIDSEAPPQTDSCS